MREIYRLAEGCKSVSVLDRTKYERTRLTERLRQRLRAAPLRLTLSMNGGREVQLRRHSQAAQPPQAGGERLLVGSGARLEAG